MAKAAINTYCSCYLKYLCLIHSLQWKNYLMDWKGRNLCFRFSCSGNYDLLYLINQLDHPLIQRGFL